jgi:uncharacterized protein (UPF0548 family)
MFYIQRPTDSVAISCLFGQRKLPFSYKETGGTRHDEAPRGYRSERYSVCLGHGRGTYEHAKTAVRQWKMFPPEMAELFWSDIPIQSGSAIGVAFRVGFLWSLNACRIVYTIEEQNGDDPNRVARFGFAYGTLPTHAMSGEECFTVEWQRADDSVWYNQAAFSRPEHWWGYLGYAFVRKKQRLFRQLSAKAMQRAICGVAETFDAHP